MGKLIGTRRSNNVGEDYFIEKAIEYFDDQTIIYWNRQLYGREFDVCILLPDKAILVVELKGWREETILRVENSDTIIIDTEDKGEVPQSPQRQARGYRFSVERHILQSLKKNPMIFQMVALPQVSKAYYHAKRLDVVTEERFTFLKEDMASNAAFFQKLNQALREVRHWHYAPFDRRTMLEVRNLYETDIDLEAPCGGGGEEGAAYHQYDYSRFYYMADPGPIPPETINKMIQAYLSGCKLYGVFSTTEQLQSAARALDEALTQRGLVRVRDSVQISFDAGRGHTPELSGQAQSFTAFHCSFSVARQAPPANPASFRITNGQYDQAQKEWLTQLGRCSSFNAEQYFAEHAAPDKNIVIRAGAGTGKTFAMIARVAFICYAQHAPLQKMAERIVMITFTNEAADQMGEKLKDYFRNCYLITSRTEYLDMIPQIDRMQISTIHSYAKQLIAALGTSFGYGIDVGITSSEFNRRKKISDILDSYIDQKRRECGPDYTDRLGMPVYAILKSILSFIRTLHNKSVDIGAIQAADFGAIQPDAPYRELHELLAAVIPAVEQSYSQDLLENNRLHLNAMMSSLSRFVNAPESQDRIRALKKDPNALQFMFVDEFQDTDDTQIQSLLTLAQLLDYKLFLVGDIKQCIYRFRGANEQAFDQLNIAADPQAWLEFSLQKNYRTDAALLDLFDRSFSAWGAREDRLLTYDAGRDRLIGTRDYNGRYRAQPDSFFHKISIVNDDARIPALVQEIQRIQQRIRYEEEELHLDLSAKDKSIAILVRENWQADLIRTGCGKLGISVQTNTGGDLYMSQPALDLMTLVNALVHFDEADHLYNLATSNFFNLDIPRSNLYQIRAKLRSGGWRAQGDEREQVNYMIRYMNMVLSSIDDEDNRWEFLVASLRTKPILQVIRKIYNTLEPWRNYSDDPWKQHYYQLNVDLLFEQLINACNVDTLTINTLQEHLYYSIVAHISVDSRIPPSDQADEPIQCITVHKSKGLEYGHVILPFCSAPIDRIKNSQLHVSAAKAGGRCHIGYRLKIVGSKTIQNDYYDEAVEESEKSREETRILYVAMTRAIRSFSWIEMDGKDNLSWQNLIETEA